MNLYVLLTVTQDDKGITPIIWHRHLYLFKEDAFKVALTMEDTSVIELTQTCSYTRSDIKLLMDMESK